MTPINAPIERLSEGPSVRMWVWISVIAVLIALAALAVIGWSWWQGRQQPAQSTSTIPPLTMFGYVREIQPTDQGAYAAVDTAEWFSGQQALEAIRADKQCTVESTSTDCTVTNGYYIRNLDDTTQPLVIDGQSTIAMQTLSIGPDGTNNWDQMIDLPQWLDLFSTSSQRDWKQTPFIFSVVSGKVTSIREQYIP